jgi:hypothetical protein
MTINNQRLILNLVEEGSITSITTEQIDFNYSDDSALHKESKILQDAGFFVLAGEGMMTVAS